MTIFSYVGDALSAPRGCGLDAELDLHRDRFARLKKIAAV